MTSRRRHHRTEHPGRTGRATPVTSRSHMDPASVADLSVMQIEHMSPGELADVVRAGRLPGDTLRAEYLDRGTLERMAYLSRLSCRNRNPWTRPR